MSNTKKLYPKLESVIAYHGENYTSLGKEIGMTPAQIGQRQKGRISWKIEELQKIAEHYQCQIQDLI